MIVYEEADEIVMYIAINWSRQFQNTLGYQFVKNSVIGLHWIIGWYFIQ